MQRTIGTLVLVSALLVQISLSIHMREMQPYQEILDVAPTQKFLGLAAFGDNEFLYRQLVMELQNAGDTGGRWSSLREYDMARVADWLRSLDTLDYRANHHLVLAGQYFSQTQNKPDLIHLVRYIQGHVALDPAEKLPWLSAALLMAEKRLEDGELALQIAEQLGSYDVPGMTSAAYQLPATIHMNWGDYAGAAAYMERALRILEGRVSLKEKQFMVDFIKHMRAKVREAEAGGSESNRL